MSVRVQSAPRRLWPVLGAAALTAALAVGQPWPAAADDETSPTRSQVQRAQDSARDAASQVGMVKAQLVMAGARLEETSLAAAKAVEAWNGARYRVAEARRAATSAQRTADGASADVARLRETVATTTVRSYESGGSLSSLGVLLQGRSTTALLDQMNAYYSVTGALQSDLGGYESAEAVAAVLQDQSERALDEQRAAADEAVAARAAAEQAVAAAESAVTSINAQRDALIRRLAALQDISVQLATQRQDALEQ
ncbi:MAG: hypothetical protein M3Q17_05050, partial [Actinomycetota bacterium]|nr:hypothetical protein [Actinomycetota bacterium]